jgi:sulfur carrier protein
MQIIVNGEPRQMPDAANLDALIDTLDLAGQRLAVEVNEELVPKSQFAQHHLAAGDKIEIIHAVGGG